MAIVLDGIRYESIADPEKIEAQPNLSNKMIPDRTNTSITIEDSGIGMAKNELINKLDIVANSGTEASMDGIVTGGDISIIGQSGVGFYTGYPVSDTICVASKHNDDEQCIWEAGAGGSFTVQVVTEKVYGEVKRGTKNTCYFWEAQPELLERRRVKDVVKKHSGFFGFFIDLFVVKSKEKEVC
mmetsp:Transcript_15541/g.41198  ORF Transcript_15541/g.41198 Transcript_15541/m.41198 type:complete len:184 (+) Transcript_15541:120-671(+)